MAFRLRTWTNLQPGCFASNPQQQSKQPVLVRHVTASYREHVKVKYASDEAELSRTKLLCDDLEANDGDTLVEAYGPLALQRQRQRWVDSGKSRKYVNRLVGCVVRMFKHAVSQELAPDSTWQRLKSIAPLRAGHTTARNVNRLSQCQLTLCVLQRKNYHQFSRRCCGCMWQLVCGLVSYSV